MEHIALADGTVTAYLQGMAAYVTATGFDTLT